MDKNEQLLGVLEAERDELQKELLGTQEMLGQVLAAVGEPVTVTKESLTRGLGKGAQIRIDDRVDLEAFVFYIELGDEDA